MIESKYSSRPEIQEWINEYGFLNIHTFMVYGEIVEDDINMLIHVLKPFHQIENRTTST